MGMHSLEELMLRWKQERLTSEQMIGQLVQHLGVVYERLGLVERQMGSLRLVQATANVRAESTEQQKKQRRD
jgi:hypothetical protein